MQTCIADTVHLVNRTKYIRSSFVTVLKLGTSGSKNKNNMRKNENKNKKKKKKKNEKNNDNHAAVWFI